MKKFNCPACDIDKGFSIIENVNNFTIVRCKACGLEFTESMEISYRQAYYEDMFYGDDAALKSFSILSRDKMLSRARKMITDKNWQPHNIALKYILKNFQRSDIVFEIGCGMGWFLAALESNGFNAIGMEVSEKIVNMLKKNGLTVFLGSLERLDDNIPDPDLVVLLGVIEHVGDPVGLLRSIRQRFFHSSVLVSIPNPKRWDFSVGIRNYWDYPPNHFTPVWSQKSLEIALARAGFVLSDWIFPPVTSEEIWYVYLDYLFFKLGLRKKGYFVGLTSGLNETNNLFKSFIKVAYPIFEAANTLVRHISYPWLDFIADKINKRGVSGLSAVAFACPKK